MDFRDRVLYHQIHPAKLATDGITAIIATLLLWKRELPLALAVGLVPPPDHIAAPDSLREA